MLSSGSSNSVGGGVDGKDIHEPPLWQWLYPIRK